MNPKHRIIRAQISVKCRERAIDYIKAFHLLPDEEAYIIEREVNGLLIDGIARKYNTSAATVERVRHDAFCKMCDAMEYAKENRNESII